jgi:hypothetical protein
MSSTPSEQGSNQSNEQSNDIALSECLYWDCACGCRNYAYWIPEELSDKHCQRIRKRGRGVGQTVWHIRIPRRVKCDGCGQKFRTKPFLAE